MFHKFCLFIASSAMLASCFKPAHGSSFKPASNPVVAHRGAWKTEGLPENSIAALKAAIDLGCTGSEFDVRMTADDSLIINHDPAWHKLAIETNTYAALTQFPLSNGEKLPTLREYLLAGARSNRHTYLVCEIKPSEISKERGQVIAARVLALVREMRVENSVVFISFDYNILKKILELAPDARTQYLEGDRNPGQLKADGVRGADFHHSVYREHPDWVVMARQNHILLNAWTVNEKSDMEWLMSEGFDYITTNEPEMALALWKAKGNK